MAEDEKKEEVLTATEDVVAPAAETASQAVEEMKAESTTEETATAPSEKVESASEAPVQASETSSEQEESVPAAEASQCQQMKECIDSAVQQILTAFKGLQESFDGKLRYDAKKQEIIDRQYQELSQFKAGLVEKVTLQIINDLIGEIDSAQKLVHFYENAEFNESNFKKLQKVLRDIPASLCDVLEKYGVTSYSSTVGTPFNPKRQRALKTTETGDASKDKTVRELLRLGFEQELEAKDDQPPKMKVLRSEMVDVFVFNPALAEASSEEKQQEPPKEAEEQAEAPSSESN
ncbi:MAG: nucleotide exchange factor GrpE [Victivallales bacterium]|nr:nucleotide exchange factor GrpE [Victivallales bacterium]